MLFPSIHNRTSALRNLEVKKSMNIIMPIHLVYILSQPKIPHRLSFSIQLLGRQHYRLYTIQSIPSLKVLDHQRITQTERDRAKRLAGSAAGAALESDIQDEAGRQNTNTFTPGEGASAEESFVVNFTAEEKDQIRQMVANAESPEEIEEIERSVQRGILPKQTLNNSVAGGESGKRPLTLSSAEEDGTNGSSEKKIKSEQ